MQENFYEKNLEWKGLLNWWSVMKIEMYGSGNSCQLHHAERDCNVYDADGNWCVKNMHGINLHMGTDEK